MTDMAVVVTADKAVDNPSLGAVFDIAAKGGGFVFLPPCSAYTGKGELILNGQGESELACYPLNFPPPAPGQHLMPGASAEKRKMRSNTLLAKHGIPLCPELPPLPEESRIRLRSRAEIVERATGMLMASLYAERLRDTGDIRVGRSFVESIIEEYKAEPYLTPGEKAFLTDDAPQVDAVIRYVWRYECYWVALWVLGFIEELSFPDTICDVPYMVSFLRDKGSVAAFTEAATMRGVTEILDQADLIYRYDWACVDADVKKQPPPSHLEPSVVRERHRMFNWLIHYMNQHWDAVCADT
jgi:hypothetical protein